MVHTMEREELDQFIQEVRHAHYLIGKDIQVLDGSIWKVQSVRIETEDRWPRPEIILVCDYGAEGTLNCVERVVGETVNGVGVAS